MTLSFGISLQWNWRLMYAVFLDSITATQSDSRCIDLPNESKRLCGLIPACLQSTNCASIDAVALNRNRSRYVGKVQDITALHSRD
jgi:hypothetical protein